MRVGYMAMPRDFKYLSVFIKGKPRHDGDFLRRHPAMETGQRAKIFSPYEALRGFSDEVAAKDITYIDKPEICDDGKEAIDRALRALAEKTRGRRTGENRVRAAVLYFEPCADKNSDSYGVRGRRVSAAGVCRRVGGGSVTIGDTVIPFDRVLGVRITEEA